MQLCSRSPNNTPVEILHHDEGHTLTRSRVGSPISCQRSQIVSSPTHPSPSNPVYFILGGGGGGGKEQARTMANEARPHGGREAATHPSRQPRETPVQVSQVCQVWESGLREKKEPSRGWNTRPFGYQLQLHVIEWNSITACVAVLGRKWRLFHRVFQLRHCVQSAVSLNFR